ncbi:YihY/virulence factor BrkB family protein [Oryzihumus leptocrescens]|uniref:YihY/virulence factor BrkB family protein n=1 Tax=Oryzihumus leptocrescens TaxID=297536 RepID=UPI00115053B0|nr:YihY/virulence factor BrkB family protein [Oryzihumus leptocrescens]
MAASVPGQQPVPGQPPASGEPPTPSDAVPPAPAVGAAPGSGGGAVPTTPRLSTHVPQRLPARARALVERVDHALEKAEATTAGRVRRRALEMDLVHQAMVLAALAMMLLIPALITLSALVPLGDSHGVATTVTRRLGLSAQAAHDVQLLFGGPGVKRTSTSYIGALVTLVSAYTWPAALQKGYEIAWQLPGRGVRDLWRPLVWLATMLGAATLVVVLGGSSEHGVSRVWLLPLGLTPVVFAWAWWTQHLLLGGRVGWRPLLTGAATITVGLYGLRAFAAVSLSDSITYNFDRYGPIGIVFMLLSWFIGFSVVMLGGAVVGQEWWSARQRRLEARRAARADQADQRP